MIDIHIIAKGNKVVENVKISDTTLVENALVLRRIEEIKQDLLNKEYASEFEAREE